MYVLVEVVEQHRTTAVVIALSGSRTKLTGFDSRAAVSLRIDSGYAGNSIS